MNVRVWDPQPQPSADDFHREGSPGSQPGPDLSPVTHLYPGGRWPSAPGRCARNGRYQKRPPGEPHWLCRENGSRPQTSATHPPSVLPFYFSHLLLGPHVHLPGRQRGPCGCQPPSPPSQGPPGPCRLPPLPQPRPLRCREVFICGVGSIFKKRFSSFSEGAKYSTGINRDTDIKPKCPCENHAGWKELLEDLMKLPHPSNQPQLQALGEAATGF